MRGVFRLAEVDSSVHIGLFQKEACTRQTRERDLRRAKLKVQGLSETRKQLNNVSNGINEYRADDRPNEWRKELVDAG